MNKPALPPSAKQPLSKPANGTPAGQRPWQPVQDFAQGVEVTEMSDTGMSELWDLFPPTQPDKG